MPAPKPSNKRIRKYAAPAAHAVFITRRQAAEITSLDIQSIDKAIRTGELETFYPLKHKVLLRYVQVLRWVEERKGSRP